MLHDYTTETVDFESQLTKELYEAYNLKNLICYFGLLQSIHYRHHIIK
jgi:hypothetical protein